MATVGTLDKEETTGAIEAGKQIFLRFGTTRGFNQFMLLAFLYGVARLEPTMARFCMALGTITSLLVLLSFHKKPHIDRMEQKGEAAPAEAGK